MFTIALFVASFCLGGSEDYRYKGESFRQISDVLQEVEQDLQREWSHDWLEAFEVLGNAPVDKAEIIVIPDLHNDAFSKLVQARVVHQLSKPNDAVFFELPHDLPVFEKGCGYMAVAQLSLVNWDADDQLAYKQAILNSNVVSHLQNSRAFWPHAEHMTCGGWDNFGLYVTDAQRQSFLSAGQRQSEISALFAGNADQIIDMREKAIAPYGISLEQVTLDEVTFDSATYMPVFQVAMVGSGFARNRHMIKVINAQMAKAPSNRIFIFAGALHTPFCLGGCQAGFERSHKIELGELTPFLQGKKYAVLAHKSLFM